MDQGDKKGKWARQLCIGSHIFFVLFNIAWSIAAVVEFRAQKTFSAMSLIAYLMGVTAWSLLQAAYFMRRQPTADHARPAA
jgi:hypothetical protein